jgi:peptidoglycan/LPS O-acetylase OafA/YrhL
MMMIFMSHFAFNGIGAFDEGGDCGVSFFFILSGFVLSYAYSDSIERGNFHPNRLLRKQLIKFYPLYIVCMLAYIAINIHTLHQSDILRIIPSVFLIQSWIPCPDYYFAGNATSWFLSDIIFFYLLFPMIYKRISTTSSKTLSVSIFFIVLIYFYAIFLIPEERINDIVYIHPVIRLITFSIGILLFRIYKSITCSKKMNLICHLSFVQKTVLEMIPFILLGVSLTIYYYVDIRIRCDSLFWVPISFVILSLSLLNYRGGGITYILNNTVLQKGGALTLEIFLIHLLAINLIERVFLRLQIDIPYMLVLSVCVVVTLMLAIFVKKYFVCPITEYLNKEDNKKKSY